MIEQNVHVLQCNVERVWVRMGSQTGCTACDKGQGCGAGLFAKLLRRKPVVLELARNDVDVEAGQMLTLAFPEQLFMKLVLTSYGWPLLAALAGAYAGFVAGSELQLGSQMTDVLTLVAGGLAASKGQARKDIEGGGVYLNNSREANAQRVVSASDLLFGKHLLLRKGKRNYAVITAR